MCATSNRKLRTVAIGVCQAVVVLQSVHPGFADAVVIIAFWNTPTQAACRR